MCNIYLAPSIMKNIFKDDAKIHVHMLVLIPQNFQFWFHGIFGKYLKYRWPKRKAVARFRLGLITCVKVKCQSVQDQFSDGSFKTQDKETFWALLKCSSYFHLFFIYWTVLGRNRKQDRIISKRLYHGKREEEFRKWALKWEDTDLIIDCDIIETADDTGNSH